MVCSVSLCAVFCVCVRCVFYGVMLHGMPFGVYDLCWSVCVALCACVILCVNPCGMLYGLSAVLFNVCDFFEQACVDAGCV